MDPSVRPDSNSFGMGPRGRGSGNLGSGAIRWMRKTCVWLSVQPKWICSTSWNVSKFRHGGKERRRHLVVPLKVASISKLAGRAEEVSRLVGLASRGFEEFMGPFSSSVVFSDLMNSFEPGGWVGAWALLAAIGLARWSDERDTFWAFGMMILLLLRLRVMISM